MLPAIQLKRTISWHMLYDYLYLLWITPRWYLGTRKKYVDVSFTTELNARNRARYLSDVATGPTIKI